MAWYVWIMLLVFCITLGSKRIPKIRVSERTESLGKGKVFLEYSNIRYYILIKEMNVKHNEKRAAIFPLRKGTLNIMRRGQPFFRLLQAKFFYTRKNVLHKLLHSRVAKLMPPPFIMHEGITFCYLCYPFFIRTNHAVMFLKNLLQKVLWKSLFSNYKITKNEFLLQSLSGILLATWFHIRIFRKFWEKPFGRLIRGSYFLGKRTGEIDLCEE